MMVKRLSIIAIILAAAVLAYGFIDARSYRAGYAAGSIKMNRLVDVACENGLVGDDTLCEAAEVALHPVPPDVVIGLAQVSTALVPDQPVFTGASVSVISDTSVTPAPKKRIRKSKIKKAEEQKIEIVSITETAPVIESTASVQPPPLSPDDEKAYARITKAKELSEDFCSQHKTNRSICADKGFPYCDMSTGTCAFKGVITELRAISTGQEGRYIPCLTSQIIDMIGVAKLVGNNFCVATNGSSQLVDRNNPSEKRFSNEFARNPQFKKDLAEAGVSASTAVTPITVIQAPTRPSCRSFMGTNTPMPPGGCEPDSNMMPMHGGYMPPRQSSLYKPSVFAQLIDVIMNLFR